MNDWVFYVVAAFMVLASIVVYTIYLRAPQTRWGTLDHDRNAHFLSAIQLAVDLRTADFAQLVIDLSRLRTWPPLHALAIGLWSAVMGTDYRVAVLPNLFVWAIGGVLIYRLAFVVTAQLSGSNGDMGNEESRVWFARLSGAAALAFYLTSPAHQAYATDFMLETLGSTLTLLAIYCYVKDGLWSASIRLPAALSLIFFAKYNYWLLIVLSIFLVEIWSHQRLIASTLRQAPLRPLLAWGKRQATTACNFPMFGLVAYFIVAQFVRPWFTDQPQGTRKHENTIYFIYLSVVFSVAWQWKSEFRPRWNSLGTPVHRFVLWHIVPIMAWFALPKRLGYFLWYLGPNNGPNSLGRSYLDSATYYWQSGYQDYHTAGWSAMIAIVAASTAMVFIGAGRQSRIWILNVFLMIGLCLLLRHANQKGRFLHTWIPLLWVLAGVGVSVAWSRIASLLALSSFHNSTLQRVHHWAIGGCTFVLIALATWHVDGGHAQESQRYRSASSLELAERYLPWLQNADHPAIFGTLPFQYYAEWTYLAKYPDHSRPLTFAQMQWFNQDRQQNAQRFDQWIAEEHPDSIVLVDIDHDSPIGFPEAEHYAQLKSLVESRPEYTCVQRDEIPSLACGISLWQRRDSVASHGSQTTNKVR